MGLFEKLFGIEEEFQATELKAIEDFNNARVRFIDLYPVLEYKNGIYLTKTGIGFILQLFLPPYMGDGDEAIFESLLTRPYPNGTIIGFFSYADPNIKPFLDYWLSLHSFRPNVKHPEVIEKLVKNRYNYYLNASKKGFWEGAKPRIFQNFIWFLFPFDKEKDPEVLLKEVKSEKIAVEGILRNYAPVDVPPSKLVSVLKSVFIPGFEGTFNAKNININAQVLDGDAVLSLEEDKEAYDLVCKKNGKKKIWRGFRVDTYPSYMTLYKFQNIFFPYLDRGITTLLPEPFVFALVVRVRDPAKRKMILEQKARYMIHSADKNPLIKFFPKIAEKAQEARYVLELTEEGKLPLEASHFFFLASEDIDKLNKIASAFESKLFENGFTLTRESGTSLVNSLLECLPLGTIPFRNDLFMRYSTLFSSNIAAMIPFIGQTPSSPDPINLYVDRKYAIFGFNRFYSKTNYNEITVAESGGGKSFSKGDDQLLSLSYGCIIRVIDKGRSYENLCKLVGGEFIDFREEDKPCFNPFTKITTNEDGTIHEDELAILVSLVGILAGMDLSMDDLKDEGTKARAVSFIINAIERAWKKVGRKMGIKEVYEELKLMEDETNEKLPQKIATALYPFAEGPYKSYFNGENNVNYTLDYVVLEIENLSTKDQRLQMAVLTSLIMQILREFILRKKQEDMGLLQPRKKILYIDEAWELLKLTNISKFMETAARIFRKYDASLEIISQTYEDFLSGETQRAIFNNSAHLFALYPKKSDVMKAFKEGVLPFNEFQVELISSLTTVPGKFSEFYIVSNTIEGSGRLIVDRFSYWLFTTKGTERTIRERIIQQYGIEKGLEILAGQPPVIDILVERGRITPIQKYALQKLLEDPMFKGKTEEEVAVMLGFVSKRDIEELKKEIEFTVERIKQEVMV